MLQTQRMLFIARYRNASMHQKPELLAQQHGFEVLQVLPSEWRDEYGTVGQSDRTASQISLTRLPLAMRGRPNDPHRSTYRTLDFDMRAFQPDVIVAEEEPDSLAALQIAAARALFAPRAKLALYTWQNIARPLGFLANSVMRMALRASDMTICANSEAIALLKALGYRKPTPLIPAVGVDTRLFFPELRARSEGALHVGYIGRLDMNKGLDTLITACAAARPHIAQISFIGDGPDRAQVESALVEANLSATSTLHGALPPDQLAAALRQLDVLILASRTTAVWKEQFGRVLTEAMACGVCVIGSDSGAIPEVIGDAGLIFPEGNAAQLAAQLIKLAQDPPLCADLRQRGQRRVLQDYTNESIAAKTANSIRTLLHS